MRNDRDLVLLGSPTTRRRLLAVGAAGLVFPVLLRPGFGAALKESNTSDIETYGLSIFGDLQLPKDFAHLPYVDPKAPKGGEIKLQITGTSGNQNFLTFNTLNIFNLPATVPPAWRRASTV